MSRKVKTALCLLLSLLLLLPLNVIASAATTSESQVQPRWSYTDATYAGLSIAPDGKSISIADAEGYQNITTKIHIKMTLQKYTVLWWSKVETWEATFNTYYAAMNEITYVNSGTYRVKAEFTVYSGSNSEEITMFSQENKFTKS